MQCGYDVGADRTVDDSGERLAGAGDGLTVMTLTMASERTTSRASRVLRAGRIAVDPARHEAHVDGRLLKLTLCEFRLLQLLCQRPGWVFSPDHIMAGLEALGVSVHRGGLKNHVWMLRRKLGEAADQLRTVRGVGYRLDDSTIAER